MQFQFDHVVQYTDEPNKAIEGFKEKGINVVEGGAHNRGGTYNTLSYFDLSYIEFLGTTDIELLKDMEHPGHSLLETIVNNNFKEGFAKFAIRTTNIEAAAKHFREKGLTANGPFPLARKRPDGSVIEWQLLYPGEKGESLGLPFIIQWNESDEERKKDLTERNTITEHPSEAQFSHLTFAVDDLTKTVQKWSNYLNLKTGHVSFDEELQANTQTLLLPGGNLVFASPTGDGIVSNILEQHGEKLFQTNLTGNIDQSFEFFGAKYKMKKI